MSTVVFAGEHDAVLTGDVIAHLETQLNSARRLLQIVLKQGEAIRERNVQSVVALSGMLQAEMQRRVLLEDERSRLLDRAGARLGIAAGSVTLTLLSSLMDERSATMSLERSLELRGLLAELQREHQCNRALMQQELAFLDHLLRLADGRADSTYDSVGERPTATPTLGAQRRMLDLQA
jgi:flagellar biosynthesis/type III secretory pathway chaperone